MTSVNGQHLGVLCIFLLLLFFFYKSLCVPHLFSEGHQKKQQKPLISLSQVTWAAVFLSATLKLGEVLFGEWLEDRERQEGGDHCPGADWNLTPLHVSATVCRAAGRALRPTRLVALRKGAART